MSEKKEILRPETNNLRRLYVERNYPSMKAMAEDLGEEPGPFRKYFWITNPVIPRITKLESWASKLNISVDEFFYNGDTIQWPRPLKEHKIIHKKGLSYREAKSLRDSLRHMVAEQGLSPEEISWFLTDE